MADPPQDTGFSLLEVLVVLAITALVATVLAATILRSRTAEERWAADLSRFFREARATALRTGTPVVVGLAGDNARTGATSLGWTAPAVTYQVSGTEQTTALLLLDGTGFAIAGPVSVTRAGESWDVSQLLSSSGP